MSNNQVPASDSSLSTRAAVWSALIAAVALGVSAYFSSQALETANEALKLSQDSSLQEVASHVYVGEAPASIEKGGATPAIRTVTNGNAVDIYDVWVDGTTRDGPAFVHIWTVQACTGYTLPASDFTPTSVHFFDGTTHWRRTENGGLSKDENAAAPTDEPSMDSPGTFRATGC